MTPLQSLIWFVANLIVIVAVLVIGTLGAADVLTKRGRDLQKAVRRADIQRSSRPQDVLVPDRRHRLVTRHAPTSR